ncbi:unnamed protein product [Schistosoma mattheei]|uniref:Uncharacterized protein n=1 Tax=Schistosoma mattheei TaxID=31246 RepID=A0A183P2E4_9TREM|nr:unnamed protein product [Schistosoma mattheei]
MKDSVDAQIRDQQAGSRNDRSCTDQVATLRIIVEQSLEWNSSLYINSIDYEKAFEQNNTMGASLTLRRAKEHITSRNGDGHGKNEQKLDRTGKKGPGQSGLENADRQSTLHLE